MLNKHKIEYLFFTAFVKLFRTIGLKRTRHSAKYFAYILYYVIRLRRRVVIENLKTALPQKSEAEIKKLALQTYRNILITFFELMYLPNFKKEEIDLAIVIDNFDEIKSKVASSRAVIFITGHLAGWELCMSLLPFKIERQIIFLAQAQSNPLVSDWIMKARKTFGAEIILSGVSFRHLYESVKNGGAVGIVGDQRGTLEGKRFTFFGRPTALHTGAAQIALKTKCPVIMIACQRQKDFSYKMYMEELSFENLPDDGDEKIKELTQRYISFLEKHIQKNPEQYFWLHKIWKY
ncbi:MAG: lysophospholipid acyltransferase family protein [Bacteroidota bacterium]